ncbi:MAG TPA: hypothetical protein VFC21_11795 [Bryobacteraceae bacterium]|nr:hypothetical protein [Bryobacteraceae bacterium]
MIARWLLILAMASGCCAAEDYSYWIEPCAPETAKATTCEAGDPELARWALEAWQRESNRALIFHKSATEEHARIRLQWANGTTSLYGETQPVTVDGKRGAVIYVLPGITAGASGDRLMRDAIVYLTCLHESGHALGLEHTAAFADIMYSFQYGGDIAGYFQRYRDQLKSREDIRLHSGVSDADRVTIRSLFK